MKLTNDGRKCFLISQLVADPMLPTSSPTNTISAEILSDGPYSALTQGYIASRASNAFFEYVIEKFRSAEANGLTQAVLARRIGKRPEQVSRIFSTPGNWTIETAALLLAGIAAEELVPYSKSFVGRVASNQHVAEVVSFGESNWKSATSNEIKLNRLDLSWSLPSAAGSRP